MMNEKIKTTEKKEKPEKNEVENEKREIVDSPLSRLWGICKGQISYESDDIFFQYRFTQ